MFNSSMDLQASFAIATFLREGDRFARRIVLRQESPDAAVGLRSVPGTSLEDWPCDPPLQQLVMEPIGTPPRTVALGVGMSGAGHWSLVAEVTLQDDSRGIASEGIQLDWACRIHRTAEWLGSSYQAIGPMSPIAERWTDRHAEWELADGMRMILMVSEGRIVWNARDAILSIVPASDIRSPGTHLWRYCFTVA